ncbi:hypothetical protein D3C87_1636540 [compost metagenome]
MCGLIPEFFSLAQDSDALPTSSRLATISVTTNPAPKRQAKVRNGRSVTPDIGASATRLRISIFPIRSGDDRAGAGKCISFRHMLFLHYF